MMMGRKWREISWIDFCRHIFVLWSSLIVILPIPSKITGLGGSGDLCQIRNNCKQERWQTVLLPCSSIAKFKGLALQTKGCNWNPWRLQTNSTNTTKHAQDRMLKDNKDPAQTPDQSRSISRLCRNMHPCRKESGIVWIPIYRSLYMQQMCISVPMHAAHIPSYLDAPLPINFYLPLLLGGGSIPHHILYYNLIVSLLTCPTELYTWI